MKALLWLWGQKEQAGIECMIPFYTIMQVCNNMFIEIKINIVIMRHLLLKVFKKIRKVFVGGVKKNIHGKNNKIVVLSSLKGIGTLTITMRGNNNIVKVGQ